MGGQHALAFIFWASACIIFYTYVGYPVLMYFLSWLRPRPTTQSPILPTVSIIMAVHNGAAVLAQKVDRLLSLDYPEDRVEILIASDGCTDGTDDILKELSHPRLKTIHCSEHRGKASALNSAMRCATGDILLFVDVRPWLERNALRQLVRNFADPSVGCAAGELILCEKDHAEGAKAVGNLYWRYEQWIRNSEALVDSPVGVYGGFYAVRRELSQLLPEGTILDDMLQPLSVIRLGYRSVLDSSARVYDIWPNNLRGEFHRKVRTLAGNFQLLQIAPWVLLRANRLRFELISHKLLRLLVPALLFVLLVTSADLASASWFYTGALAAQIAFYLLALAGGLKSLPTLVRIAAPARAFCMLNAAAVAGFYKFMFTRGPLWKIWTPVPSTSIASNTDQRIA